MPIPQFNIPTEATPNAIIQVREAIRLLIAQANTNEHNIQQLTLPQLETPHPSLSQTIVTKQELTGNVTGLLGLLAQGQHTLVPKYSATPSLSDPAIINGSLFLDSSNHLWYVQKASEPFTFTDLTALAMSSALAVGTHAARPAASATNTNTLYFETDTFWLYYSDGTNWKYIAGEDIGTRATRVALTMAASDANAQFFETDTSWRYYYSGSAWVYENGIYKGTRSTRTGLTIGSADNGALFYETDLHQLWRVSSGAWTLASIGAIISDPTVVTVNASTTSDQTLYSGNLYGDLLNNANRTIRVTVSGTYDVDTAANITWKIKLGGVTILSWTPATPAGVKTNLPFRLVAEITVVSTGASGTVEAHGVVTAANKTTAGMSPGVQLDSNTAVSSAIDFTASTVALEVDIAFDTSSTSNVGKKRNIGVEVLF